MGFNTEQIDIHIYKQLVYFDFLCERSAINVEDI